MPPSKEQAYSALSQNQSSVSDDFGSEQDTIAEEEPRRRGLKLHTVTIILAACCTLLSVIVAVQTAVIWRAYQHVKHITKFDASCHMLEIGGIVPRIANAHSAFDSPNETIAAAAWDGIEAGHGDVVVDPEWAARQGLPPSAEHPYMPGKSVYVIEAYHAIHCLKVLRNHYMAMHTPTPGSLKKSEWPLEHDVHCFDSLRQHVMCHADYTLLYTLNDHHAGVEQHRMCRDWDELRDWATEISAHWKDHINPNPEGEIWWGFDDGGDDGLPRGSL